MHYHLLVTCELLRQHAHPVHRQSSRLVCTDDSGRAHGLASMKLAYQILDLQHLTHAESQTYRNAHRKAFRHCDNNKRHRYHYGIKRIVKYLQKVRIICRITIKCEIIHSPSYDYQSCQDIAYLCDQIAEIAKLPVERSLHLLIFHYLQRTFSLFCIHTHGCHPVKAESFKHYGTTKKEVSIISRIFFGL